MSVDTAVDLDAILKELGPFGTYNIINFAMLLFPCYLAGMYVDVFVFEALDINYRCEIIECESLGEFSSWLHLAIPKEKGELSKCYRYGFSNNFLKSNSTCSFDNIRNIFNTKVKKKCSSFVYSRQDSAVKDFDLGCQNWKRTLIGTIHSAGYFFALPITGFISDKYGRKVAMSITALNNSIFGMLRSFSVNYYMMVMLEFLEAASGAGVYTTSFVLAMELVVPKGRVFGNTLINMFFVSGLITLSGLSWLLQDWRTLLRVIYAPSCLVFSYLWILNESVRWLISKGRYEEALVILKKAAKMNKVELSEQNLAPLYDMAKEKPMTERDRVTDNDRDEDEDRSSVYIRVIKSSIIRKRVVTCSFLWMTCTFIYYGLAINSVSLAGNMYINFMLVAFIEIPANFSCLFLLDRYGRKRVMITAYMLSALLCISLSFVPKHMSWVSLVIYLSGKFSITIAYSSVYIFVSEVFPTNIRQSLLGVCSCTGRIGSTLAPLTPLLALYYENLPSIFFSTLAVTAGLLVFTLPETLHQSLPDTIQEAESISTLRSPKRDS